MQAAGTRLQLSGEEHARGSQDYLLRGEIREQGFPMAEHEYPGLTGLQEKALKNAVEGTCELCSAYCAFPLLEIHRISRRLYREMIHDPSTRILVVCHDCHHHIHHLPLRVKDQRKIVSRRSFFTRRDLRRALGYRPKPYKPPDSTDEVEIYDEYFFHFPPGSFRLSG
jgi:hypothetical protein